MRDRQQISDVFGRENLESMLEFDQYAQKVSQDYEPVDMMLVPAPGIKAWCWRAVGSVIRSVVSIQPIWEMGCRITERGQIPFREWLARNEKDVRQI